MTDIRKITPEEISAAVSEMNRELKAVGEGAIDRIDCSPENIEQGLARLVLSLIELLRRLLERQAIRRMEGGSLGDAKVEEMGQALFGKYIGDELPKALWSVQREIYGVSSRRPYVIVGLPFVSVRPNAVDAVSFMNKAYVDGIAHWSDRARNSPQEEVRRNARRFSDFLAEDLQAFRQKLVVGRPPRR